MSVQLLLTCPVFSDFDVVLIELPILFFDLQRLVFDFILVFRSFLFSFFQERQTLNLFPCDLFYLRLIYDFFLATMGIRTPFGEQTTSPMIVSMSSFALVCVPITATILPLLSIFFCLLLLSHLFFNHRLTACRLQLLFLLSEIDFSYPGLSFGLSRTLSGSLGLSLSLIYSS